MRQPLTLTEDGGNDYRATGGCFWIEWQGWSLFIAPKARGRVEIEAYALGREGEEALHSLDLPARRAPAGKVRP